jgi:hypothetical protein
MLPTQPQTVATPGCSPGAGPHKGPAMPSPEPLQPAPLGAQIQPPVPASPELPRTPRASRRLESSFSVEAILARPDASAQAASPPPVSACAAPSLWTAPPGPPASVLSWAYPATWLPTYLSVGVYPLCPQPSVPVLRVAHFCGLQGLGVTGTAEPGARVRANGRG